MSKLKLNCWIYGTPHDLLFPVKINATETVADLKIAIKAENTHSFQSIDAYFIDLWDVSILYDDHFEENLEKFNVNSKPRLKTRIKLSSLFSDRSTDDRLDIVVRAPGFSLRHIDDEPAQLLQLNCLIVEQEAKRIFQVEIETGKTVADLKEVIKDMKKPTVDHIPANALDLWKVSFEIDNNFQGNLEKPAERPLLPIMELSEVFPEYPARKHLHILVNVPPVSINASSSLTDPCQVFPYRRHFTSLVDSTIQEFEYVAQPSEAHLVFFAKLSDGYDICIKFTQEYSQKMHQFCALKGFAPNVLGCERIPGGWWMVVMDKIDEDYVEFHQAPRVSVLENLKCFLDCLHQEGFVHGDLRDTNIMVPRSGENRFLLIDFDWGGRIGEVRYPMNVYRGRGLWRPEGVCDGHLILAEHDDEMLKYMFSIYGTDDDDR